MNPDHRKAIHAAIDTAINRGLHLSVGFHPRRISDEGVLLSGISALAHPNPWALEFQQGERHGWWQVDSSTAHVVVHQAQDRSPEPVQLDRTQVDRAVPYVAEVTVATTPHKGEGWVEATGPQVTTPNHPGLSDAGW